MPYKETDEDVMLHFKNTIVGIHNGNKIYPFFVNNIYTENGEILLSGIEYDGESTKETIIPYNDDKLYNKYPPLGVVNLSKSVAVLNRKLVKQHRKYMTSDTVNLFDPNHKERLLLKMPIIEGIKNKLLLYSVFNPKYFTLKKALQLVRTHKRISAAFNNTFYFSCVYSNDNIYLCRKYYKVGVMDIKEEHPTVILEKKLLSFKEEIEENGIIVKIKGEKNGN